MSYDYYLEIKQEYHLEVDHLLQTLEISVVTDQIAKEKEKALQRLEELKRLSK